MVFDHSNGSYLAMFSLNSVTIIVVEGIRLLGISRHLIQTMNLSKLCFRGVLFVFYINIHVFSSTQIFGHSSAL